MSFEYQVLKRPRRRTVAISVKPDCIVRILVPANLSDQRIAELVKQKSNWIESKIAYFQEIRKLHIKKKYVSGEYFAYLGRNYCLKIVQDDTDEDVKLMNGTFIVPVPPYRHEDTQTHLIIQRLSKWYQQRAVIRLEEKVRHYAKHVGISPTCVGIKGYKSRWGSCHSDGRVYFNWRIILAPHPVIDYLVVHELCHLVHHNHSRKFWNLVKTILPDYKERQGWLKVNGIKLNV